MNGTPWYFQPNPFGLFTVPPFQPVEPTPQPIEPIPVEPGPQPSDKWTVWKTPIDQFCRYPADKPAPYFGLTFYQTGLLTDKLVYPNGDVTTIEGVGVCVVGTPTTEPAPIVTPSTPTNIDDICKCIKGLANALDKIANNKIDWQPTGDMAYFLGEEDKESQIDKLWNAIGFLPSDFLGGQTPAGWNQTAIQDVLTFKPGE